MHQAYPQQAYPQAPPQPPYPQAQATTAQYEFGDAENKTIATAAARAQLWGVVSLVLGVIQLGVSQLNVARTSFFAMATMLSGGVVNIVVGLVFLGVATSFAAVVKSRGNDVTLMMQGLGKLSTALTIQIVVAIVGFAVGFACGALGVA
jgi:hypothetical protein